MAVNHLNGEKAAVGIIMGSESDLNVMKKAAEVLDEFDIKYEMTIVSAHRTPDRLFDYAKHAQHRGLEVIVAGAGGAAHLPGMVASITSLPVIGVPIKSHALNGLDSLLSIVQMPKGVPVATMAIDGAANAGILAAQILGLKDSTLRGKISEYKNKLEQSVLQSAKRVEGETNND